MATKTECKRRAIPGTPITTYLYTHLCYWYRQNKNKIVVVLVLCTSRSSCLLALASSTLAATAVCWCGALQNTHQQNTNIRKQKKRKKSNKQTKQTKTNKSNCEIYVLASSPDSCFVVNGQSTHIAATCRARSLVGIDIDEALIAHASLRSQVCLFFCYASAIAANACACGWMLGSWGDGAHYFARWRWFWPWCGLSILSSTIRTSSLDQFIFFEFNSIDCNI